MDGWYCGDCDDLEYEKSCIFKPSLYTEAFCKKYGMRLMITADGKNCCRCDECSGDE